MGKSTPTRPHGSELCVVPYARVSTKLQEHPDAQVAELRRVGANRGWRWACEPFIETASGADRARPELARAMALIRAGRANALAAVSLDRISRSLTHTLEIFETLAAHGAALICTRDGDLDTTTPAGMAMMQLRAVFAEFERALARERSREYAAVRKSQGLRTGRPDSLSAAALARAIELRTGPRPPSWRAIRAQLVSEGFPSHPPATLHRRAQQAAGGPPGGLPGEPM
jgi:DNA invertase Pin-like site-specific DNA recombinase